VKRSLDRAAELGVDAVQLFVQSPRTWRFPDHDPADLAAFRERRRELGLGSVLVHALYLVNLASPNDDVYAKSVQTLRSTVDAACAIGAEGVVFHVGSHQGSGFEAGLARVVPALAQALERCSDTTWLLLENSAGAGGTIGRSPAELAALLDELDRRIGLDRLRAVHVNDAQAPLGSNRDRHANIGDGVMGERLGAFLGHPKLQGLPAVLEVPGPDNHGPDANEVRKLRELHARWT
jgi:deoxyribonuclease-4